jgi:hypothetical protein
MFLKGRFFARLPLLLKFSNNFVWKAPSKSAINRLVSEFESTRGAVDNMKDLVGKKEDRIPENLFNKNSPRNISSTLPQQLQLLVLLVQILRILTVIPMSSNNVFRFL